MVFGMVRWPWWFRSDFWDASMMVLRKWSRLIKSLLQQMKWSSKNPKKTVSVDCWIALPASCRKLWSFHHLSPLQSVGTLMTSFKFVLIPRLGRNKITQASSIGGPKRSPLQIQPPWYRPESLPWVTWPRVGDCRARRGHGGLVVLCGLMCWPPSQTSSGGWMATGFTVLIPFFLRGVQ